MSCSPSSKGEKTQLKSSSAVDARFLKTSGIEAFTGNELLVKGALEAGAGLFTGYPGSPVSDVFDTLAHIAPFLAERGIVAQIANNEALATARLNGARQSGLRAMAVMKSVGFHVGADALATGNLMEFHNPRGGAVVIVGDDPWNETTQINSDSRYLSKHLHMPVVEPSTFQEMKDWIDFAFQLSGTSDLYVTYLVTTNQADGGCTVEVRSHPELPISRINKATLSSSQINISESVLIPPHTSMREATLDERRQRLLDKVRELGLNKWNGPVDTRTPVGFVCSGLSYCYLEEVLNMIGLWNQVPVLKLGMTYPVDPLEIERLAKSVQHLVVVEEKRGFIEEQVSEILISLKQQGKLAKTPALWGKKFPEGEGFPSVRGLNVSIMLEVLGPAFMTWKQYFPTLQTESIEKELAEIRNTKATSFDVPLRLPTFCPGCPHRDSAVASKKLKKNFINFDYMKKKGEKVEDVIFHGESGCHSMLQFAPNLGLMQNYSGMGIGGGTGAGMSPFVTNKQVVFLGDSTFFHSGMIAVSDSLKNNQDITYIILENDTTAMTGHQPTPGNPIDVMGQPTDKQNIERLLRGMLPTSVFILRVNPADRDNYERILEKTVLKPGVKVLIAEKECAITLHRRLNAQKKSTLKEIGFLPREERVNITPEVCEYCLECTRQTGCPGLTIEKTPYGRKIATDLSTCVDDGACARTKACPSFERVIITRERAAVKSEEAQFNLEDTPEPRVEKIEERWSAYTAAVGGMGAGIVNAVLVRAGMKAGFEVSFLDKKGLAIRNGGVYGHVVFSANGPVRSPVIPYGKADLLIGLDLLESARGIDPKLNLRVAHPGRTRAVINNHRNETVLSLIGEQDFDPDKLEEGLRSKVRLGSYLSSDFSQYSEKIIGSKLYANMMLLGVAFQKGWIPVSEENLMEAISESVRAADVAANKKAFRYGRYLAAHPDMLYGDDQRPDLQKIVDEKIGYLKKESVLWGRGRAAAYKNLVDQAHRWMDLPIETRALLAQTLYDLTRYGGREMAANYLSLVWNTYRKDQARFGYRATIAVIENLFRCMAIKDEVWVAHLLTAPEKYERDRRRYRIDAANGDRVRYVHLNRPRFTIFGRDIEFDIETKDWMLRLMKHAGFMRKFLPQWHAEERAFRDWYTSIVQDFTYFDSPEQYDLYVRALSAPNDVRGYREIRYPAMKKAREEADAALNSIRPSEQRAGQPAKNQ